MQNDKRDGALKPNEGDPIYSGKDDIFSKDPDTHIDPETVDPVTGQEIPTPLDLDEGLDVPGAELDDAEEAIGSEDEENNYYSLGGDSHDDLDEDEDDE